MYCLQDDDIEEPLLLTRKVWPLSGNVLSPTTSPSSKTVSSPTPSVSDSRMSFVSSGGQAESCSSFSDSEHEQVC